MKKPNSFYAIKARFRKQLPGTRTQGTSLIIDEEILYVGNMKDQNNGTIGILKRDEALAIEFNKGLRNIKALSKSEYQAHFMSDMASFGFCQRRAGQSYGDYFKHEVDEFCDSFVSCVALATQPQVSILIGLACSCNASALLRPISDL